MSDRSREASGLLEARLNDHLARAGRGSVAVSRFLTPGERRVFGADIPARNGNACFCCRIFIWICRS